MMFAGRRSESLLRALGFTVYTIVVDVDLGGGSPQGDSRRLLPSRKQQRRSMVTNIEAVVEMKMNYVHYVSE